jgi:hypothetical protein
VRCRSRGIDNRKQQARYPENMHVCEHGNEGQYTYNLELHFLVCEALWQSVQAKIQDTDPENEENQDYGHCDHEHIRLTRSSDK